jgi:futalosine hydrolase
MREFLILSATEFEQSALARRLESPVKQSISGKRWITGTRGKATLRLVQGGLGAVNTAHALSCALQSWKPDLVLQLGVGGAYPNAGLQIGDLALAEAENYGDLGVRTSQGWQSSELIGIPVIGGDVDYYNHFPLDRELVARGSEVLSRQNGSAGTLRAGPFVTVQECTGTTELGIERGDRFAAICENMEGAAGAHICRLFEVPFLEIRGISNMVDDRQIERWEIPRAADVAQEAGWHLVEALLT